MKNLPLTIAAAGEAATGFALLVVPHLVIRILFGAEIVGAGVVMSRIAGLALIALGVACWPGRTAFCGMTTYSAGLRRISATGLRGCFCRHLAVARGHRACGPYGPARPRVAYEDRRRAGGTTPPMSNENDANLRSPHQPQNRPLP